MNLPGFLGSSEHKNLRIRSTRVSKAGDTTYDVHELITEFLQVRSKLRLTPIGMQPSAWEWDQCITHQMHIIQGSLKN